MIFKLFLLFLPTQLTLHFWPDYAFVEGVRVDYLAPALYFTDIIFVLLLANAILYKRFQVELKNHKITILVFLILMVINLFVSQVWQVSIYRWIRFLQYLLVYIYAKAYLKKVDFGWAFLISLVFLLVLSLLQMLKGGSIGGLLYFLGERTFTQNTSGISLFSFFGKEVLRPYATLPHPNVLAGYSLVSFFLLWTNKRKYRFIAAAVCLMLVTISFSQNAWLATLATPLVYILLKHKKTIWPLVLVVVFSLLMPLINIKLSQPELMQRVVLNRAAGEIISSSFPFGVGMGVFVVNLPGGISVGPVWWLQPVHNMFLLLMSEIGVLFLAFVWFIKKNFGRKNMLPVICILLLSLFDHYFITIQQTSLLFALVLAYNVGKESKS